MIIQKKQRLLQAQGGPCGVIASVNAQMVRPLLGQQNFNKTCVERRFTALRKAFVEILWRCGKNEDENDKNSKCCLCVMSDKGGFSDDVLNDKNHPLLKLQGIEVICF